MTGSKNPKIVLITGAGGNLGKKLCNHLRGRFELRLLDINPRGDNEIFQADLGVWDKAWVTLFHDVNTVIHLAADPNQFQTWSRLIRPNIDSVINVFSASVRSGVQRVVFASSNHVMGGYRNDQDTERISTYIPVRPGLRSVVKGKTCDSTPYSSLKLFGERLGKCYADIHGISFIAVRIGWVARGANLAKDIRYGHDEWSKMMWLSNRDFCHLMEQCIKADESIGFAIVNGMSSNRGMRWDIQYTRELLGYKPQDDIMRNDE